MTNAGWNPNFACLLPPAPPFFLIIECFMLYSLSAHYSKLDTQKSILLMSNVKTKSIIFFSCWNVVALKCKVLMPLRPIWYLDNYPFNKVHCMSFFFFKWDAIEQLKYQCSSLHCFFKWNYFEISYCLIIILIINFKVHNKNLNNVRF